MYLGKVGAACKQPAEYTQLQLGGLCNPGGISQWAPAMLFASASPLGGGAQTHRLSPETFLFQSIVFNQSSDGRNHFLPNITNKEGKQLLMDIAEHAVSAFLRPFSSLAASARCRKMQRDINAA